MPSRFSKSLVISKPLVAYILETSAQVFWIAAKLSAPMALMIFLINCAFGIVAKAVPQINVFVVSFTINRDFPKLFYEFVFHLLCQTF